MNNDTSLQVAIAVGIGSIPKVHTAAAVLTIRRCHEVGIVEPGTILGIGDNSVVLRTSTTEIVLLEVTCDFVESIPDVGDRSI